jgi:hypothetical protein
MFNHVVVEASRNLNPFFLHTSMQAAPYLANYSISFVMLRHVCLLTPTIHHCATASVLFGQPVQRRCLSMWCGATEQCQEREPQACCDFYILRSSRNTQESPTDTGAQSFALSSTSTRSWTAAASLQSASKTMLLWEQLVAAVLPSTSAAKCAMLSDDAHAWIFAVLDMVSEVDLKYSDLVVSACSDVVYTYQLLSQCGSLCKHEQLNLPVLQCLVVSFCGTAALPTTVVLNQHHAQSTCSELLL